MIKADIINVEKIKERIATVSYSYANMIAEGEIPDHYTRRICGYRSALANGTQDDISELTAALVPVPTSAVAMEILGGAQDTIAGTGIQVARVVGLDAAWQEQVTTVKLSGATPVALPGTWIRINNIHSMQVGTVGGGAAGSVNVRSVAGATVYNTISAGNNISLQAHYTIPANVVGYIFGWSASSSGAKPTKIILRTTAGWLYHTLIAGVYHTEDILNLDSVSLYKEVPIPIKCPPMCDIKVSALATGAGAGASCSIEMWFEKLEL
jgi:hypothetical protein